MQAATERAKLAALVEWIAEKTDDVNLPSDERSLIAIGCLDMTLEHQRSYELLHRNGHYGSALALLRCLSESLVRGLWLLHCATEAELDRFKKDRLEKSFQALIDEYEAKKGNGTTTLSDFKRNAWNALNGFTHTGFNQVARRHKPGLVEPNYDEEELAKSLNAAGVLGLVAAGQVIDLSDRSSTLPEFHERMREYVAAHATS